METLTLSKAIERLETLNDAKVLMSWESDFARDIVRRYYNNQKRSDFFTDKTVRVIRGIVKLYEKETV
jgi:hypothetical protein